MPAERLHKVLANAGFGSRRKCEELISRGQVTIGGRVVTEMGVKVDLERQHVNCAGRIVRVPRKVTLLFNKPRRIVTTTSDDRGRRTVMDFIQGVPERIYPIGRLDWESQGLLLLTNDGELANLLTHPRYGIPRTYHVLIKGQVSGEVLEKIKHGVWLSEGKTGPVKVFVKKRDRQGAVLEVTISEGMNREIRRIFARFHLQVKRLKRLRVGPLALAGLAEGQWRYLTGEEVARLRAAAKRGGSAEASGPGAKRHHNSGSRRNPKEGVKRR